ncbi:hypothetical protein MRB53_042231 [Persea americana]|nr:hypothetical protein MRB53_042231 [Persea americana]
MEKSINDHDDWEGGHCIIELLAGCCMHVNGAAVAFSAHGLHCRRSFSRVYRLDTTLSLRRPCFCVAEVVSYGVRYKGMFCSVSCLDIRPMVMSRSGPSTNQRAGNLVALAPVGVFGVGAPSLMLTSQATRLWRAVSRS